MAVEWATEAGLLRRPPDGPALALALALARRTMVGEAGILAADGGPSAGREDLVGREEDPVGAAADRVGQVDPLDREAAVWAVARGGRLLDSKDLPEGHGKGLRGAWEWGRWE